MEVRVGYLSRCFLGRRDTVCISESCRCIRRGRWGPRVVRPWRLSCARNVDCGYHPPSFFLRPPFAGVAGGWRGRIGLRVPSAVRWWSGRSTRSAIRIHLQSGRRWGKCRCCRRGIGRGRGPLVCILRGLVGGWGIAIVGVRAIAPGWRSIPFSLHSSHPQWVTSEWNMELVACRQAGCVWKRADDNSCQTSDRRETTHIGHRTLSGRTRLG